MDRCKMELHTQDSSRAVLYMNACGSQHTTFVQGSARRLCPRPIGKLDLGGVVERPGVLLYFMIIIVISIINIFIIIIIMIMIMMMLINMISISIIISSIIMIISIIIISLIIFVTVLVLAFVVL